MSEQHLVVRLEISRTEGLGKRHSFHFNAKAKHPISMSIRQNKYSTAQNKGEGNTDNLLWDWMQHPAPVSLPLRLAGLLRALPSCQDQECTHRNSDKEGLSSAHRGLSKSPDAGTAVGLREPESCWAIVSSQAGACVPLTVSGLVSSLGLASAARPLVITPATPGHL